MSTTLSMTQMVAKLQRKTGLGLGTNDCVDFLNEAFRKVNQMSKGGFIWQFKQTTVTIPAFPSDIPLPVDFDPGKSAILRGDGGTSVTNTIIPYMQMKEWVNQTNFLTTGAGFFAAWTFYPTFTQPITYPYVMKIGPNSAFAGVPTTMNFWYHAVNTQPIANGAANYFPTPDQFDSMIVDLAIAEVRNIYRMSGQENEVEQAVAAIAQLIDTYRTDRYDLAGLTDKVAQAQEKQTEQAK